MSDLTALLQESKAAFARSNNNIALSHLLTIIEVMINEDHGDRASSTAEEDAIAISLLSDIAGSISTTTDKVAALEAKTTDLEAKIAAITQQSCQCQTKKAAKKPAAE